MTQLSIEITFFYPFRVVPWQEETQRKTDRKYLRGGTFAKWHCIREKGEIGRPYLTGTLVRSVLYTEIEKIIVIHNPFNCCFGKDSTTEPKLSKPAFLRKRSQYSEKDDFKEPCRNCPLCFIMGRPDTVRRQNKKEMFRKLSTLPGRPDIIRQEEIKENEWAVHFSNFWEITDTEFKWKDTVSRRIINRVDPSSGKAKDYMTIWEIDPSICFKFKGAVTLNTAPDMTDKIKYLIAAGLAQINILAGTVCRTDIVSEDHNALIRCFFNSQKTQDDLPSENNTAKSGKSLQIKDLDRIKKAAKNISDIFKDEEKDQHIRRIADVIRELRGKSYDIPEFLPSGKKDGRKSVWEKSVKNVTLKEFLKAETEYIFPTDESLETEEKQILWRKFCELLGKELYRLAAASRNRIEALPRLMGETELYGLPMKEDDEREIIPLSKDSFPNFKWIITGQLRAETPFFFGTETGQDQTSASVLLNRDGFFRLPPSVIRGALRRDLRLVIGDGCDMPIGRICECKVCRIMRHVIIEDSISDCKIPPEIRYRIRLNPHTGTVEEGALFDMETGYQGIVFPFRLWFDTKERYFNFFIFKVLDFWKNGEAIFGGDTGTGLGRFKLELKNSEEAFFWDFSKNEQIKDYLLERGLKNSPVNKIKNNVPRSQYRTWRERVIAGSDKPISLNSILWEFIEYQIKIISPLISRDPINAMLDKRNPDAVTIRKCVFLSDNKNNPLPEPVSKYIIKGESIRGVFRSVVSRNEKCYDLSHEDCNCIQCQLFGSVHHQGSLRFEDTEVQNSVNDQKMDHVAIDRFTGGGVDQMKFDEYPLPASPKSPLVLKGKFWIKKDIDEKAKDALKTALTELKQGLVSLGGLDAIGYGRIGSFELTKKPDWLNLTENTGLQTFSYDQRAVKDMPDVSRTFDKNSIYHPHYFLKPSEKPVNREIKLISHVRETDDDKNTLFTGKIKCRLTTKGAVFIPDTDAGDNYFDMQKDYPEHKSLGFFRINKETAIPGSSLRGMVSSVFEALTNSCFRVLDQDRYPTRRVKAEKEEDLGDFHPGVVIRNGEAIQKLSEIIRLPLYDVEDIRNFAANKYNPQMYSDRNYYEKIKDAIVFNKNMAEYAKKNRDFLKQTYKSTISKVLRGEEPVWFKIENPTPKNHKNKPKNPNSQIAVLVNEGTYGAKTGYIKFTGPCMVNVNNDPKNKAISDCTSVSSEKWDITHIHNEVEERESLNKKYPRPCLKCIQDKVEYTMIKRCEHIFSQPKNEPDEYKIPTKVHKQYNTIIKDNRENTEHIPEMFKSRLLHENLSEGDLIYFKPDEKNKTATTIVPVRISRKTDDNPMAKRFENESLRPCHYVCVEECENCPELCKQVKDYFSPHPEGLCPACHVFGTAYYKGRVSFGTAWFDKSTNNENPKWYMTDEKNPDKGGRLTLPLLERPRPTWSMPDKTEMCDGKESVIPGRKFYVHHSWSVDNIRKRQYDSKKDDKKSDVIKPDKNNRTVEPLDKGNEFVFEVKFNNLRDWELGLLLYSLELENKLAHKLGMGKAVGMGSVQILVEEVSLKNSTSQMNKNDFIQKGFGYLTKNFGNGEIRHIKELRELLFYPENISDINVRYPELEKKDNIPGYTDFTKKPDKKKKEEVSYYMSPKARLKILQTPWESWYQMKPYEIKEEIRTGTVEWFDDQKGFGKIKDEEKGLIFVHHSAIQMSGRRTLKEGQRVSYGGIIKDDKGFKAVNVKIQK